MQDEFIRRWNSQSGKASLSPAWQGPRQSPGKLGYPSWGLLWERRKILEMEVPVLAPATLSRDPLSTFPKLSEPQLSHL